MRKVIALAGAVFLVIIIIFAVSANNSGGQSQSEFLRIHIRANSNTSADQSVKYNIKDAVVNYLTPLVNDCVTKKEALKAVKSNLKNIEKVADSVLAAQGFAYRCNAKISNEYFPTRLYDDVVFDSGYYDALILELGAAAGDNWWCVVYPPLCFLGAEGTGNVHYISKIKEWIERLKNK